MKYLIVIFSLFSATANAAKLDDVKILEVAPGTENVKLKLHSDLGKKGSYFFVDVVKTDPESFGKLALVLKKLKGKSHFRLDLNIPNFSPAPSGSYYRSNDVTFSGDELK